MSSIDFTKESWGLLDYAESLAKMRERHAQRVAGEVGDTIICVQHPAVYTLGKNGGRENIKLTDDELAEQGFAVYNVERGGDVTYHGPGQAVVYPIIDLKFRRMGVRALVQAVGRATVDVVSHFGIQAVWDDERPGVWVSGRKIAAVGLAVPKKVTMHGVALNVCPDLSHYQNIKACGLHAESTSLEKETGRPMDVDEVLELMFQKLCVRFREAEGTLAV